MQPEPTKYLQTGIHSETASHVCIDTHFSPFPSSLAPARTLSRVPQILLSVARSVIYIYITYTYWKRAWQPIPVSLPRESHGQKSLTGYSPQGCKELDTTEAIQHAYTFCCISDCSGLKTYTFNITVYLQIMYNVRTLEQYACISSLVLHDVVFIHFNNLM